MKRFASLLFVIIVLSMFSSAVDFVPSGNIDGKGLYAIKNVTQLNLSFIYSKICFGVTCVNVSNFSSGGGSESTTVDGIYLFLTGVQVNFNQTLNNNTIDARFGTIATNLQSNISLVDARVTSLNTSKVEKSDFSTQNSSYFSTFWKLVDAQTQNTSIWASIQNLISGNTTAQTRIDSLNTSKLDATDQRYNDTLRIDSINSSLITQTARIDSINSTVVSQGTTIGGLYTNITVLETFRGNIYTNVSNLQNKPDNTGGWFNTSTYITTSLPVNITSTLTAFVVRGNLTWSDLNDSSYPSACPANTYVTQIGDGITCSAVTVTGDGTGGWTNTTTYTTTVLNVNVTGNTTLGSGNQVLSTTSNGVNVTNLLLNDVLGCTEALETYANGSVYCGTDDGGTGSSDGTGGWSNTSAYTTTNLLVNITGNITSRGNYLKMRSDTEGLLWIDMNSVDGVTAVRATESNGYQGIYMKYNASSNVPSIGVHTAADALLTSDIDAITIGRSSALVTVLNNFSVTKNITLSNYASCTALETDSNGLLNCGSDATGAGSSDGTGGWTNTTINTTTALNVSVPNLFVGSGYVQDGGSCPNRPLVSVENRTLSVPSVYPTIASAVCEIPYFLRHRYSISVDPATYVGNEDVKVSQVFGTKDVAYGGGQLRFIGGSSGNYVKVNSFFFSGITGNANPKIQYYNVTGWSREYSDPNGCQICMFGVQQFDIHDTVLGSTWDNRNATHGILAYGGSKGKITKIKIENSSWFGVSVKQGSQIWIRDEGIEGFSKAIAFGVSIGDIYVHDETGGNNTLKGGSTLSNYVTDQGLLYLSDNANGVNQSAFGIDRLPDLDELTFHELSTAYRDTASRGFRLWQDETLNELKLEAKSADSTYNTIFNISRVNQDFNIFSKVIVTNLTVKNLTAASCDVKADTNGVLYCGTDANSGGAGDGSGGWTNTTNYSQIYLDLNISGNITTSANIIKNRHNSDGVWWNDLATTDGTSAFRVTESNSYTGGYFMYNGTDNTFVIGTHNAADSLLTSDLPAIEIGRATSKVTIQKNLTVNANFTMASLLSCIAPEFDSNGILYCGSHTNDHTLAFQNITGSIPDNQIANASYWWGINSSGNIAGLGFLTSTQTNTIAVNLQTNITSLVNSNTSTNARIDNLNLTKLNIADAITTYVNRSLWTTIDNYPSACTTGNLVLGIGDSLTCVPDEEAGWQNTTTYTTTNLIVNITGNVNMTKNVTINGNLFMFNTTFNGTDGNLYYNGGLRIQFNSTCTTLFSPNGAARSEVCN